ncbi:MAG TPA: penicillin acylase family protein [Actinophytocola sp.]|uniref:penicillin acylase family protein n=1 Tax=Actinophytocola sp. TaxID=1872138 RepID=UPI002DB9350A|nr:penicillin acylase family protein [Actinophytocola sp.]HEU5473354.1 penicillin acylase family protein [Actinophytocola sp.]
MLRRRKFATISTMVAVALATAPAVTSAAALPTGSLAATIRYTEYGIPHVLAGDYASLGFGQGYAAARDNACAIGQTMLTTSGRRSRHLGPDARPVSGLSQASTNLASDLYFQGINDSGAVERLLAQPAPLGPSADVRAVVRGYAAGVTEFLRRNRITDPACADAPWPRAMTQIDVYRHLYALGMVYGQASAADGIVSARPGPAGTAAAQPVEDRNIGSNAIAFGGAATANGRGLSLGNPHLPWHAPDLRLWQSHLTIPGRLDASGAGVVGVPLMWIGHNATMAWSGTAADNTRTYTLFQLRLAPGSPTTYLVDGKPEAMLRKDVSVTVRQSDGSVGTVTRAQWWTRYGPVVPRLGSTDLPWTADTAYALADANAANLRLADATLRLMRSRDARDAMHGLGEVQGLPWMNIMVTDGQGDARYGQIHSIPHVTDAHAAACNTELGERTFAERGLAVLDGSRPECAWGRDADARTPGLFGPARLPTLTRADYLANSNDSYWLINPAQPLTGYPRIVGPVGTEQKPRTRGGLVEIEQVLAHGRFTRESLQDLMLSNRNHIAELTVDDLVPACRAEPDLAEACTVLSTWDRQNDVSSRGALLFDRFWLKAGASAGPNLWLVPFTASDPVTTPNTLNTANPAVLRALSDAVAELRAAGIPLDAPFGDHHYVVRGGDRIPIGGGTARLGVYNAIGGIWDPAKGYTEMQQGTTYLHAVAFDGDRCPDSATLLTYSQSADPTSAHHSDQTKLYSHKQWVTERFCERDILAAPGLHVVHVRQYI